MTEQQATEMIGWLKVQLVASLAMGLVAVLALVALCVVTLWRSS